jgi:hypothetical protein
MIDGIDYFFVKMLVDLARSQGSPNVIQALIDKSTQTILNGDGAQIISVNDNGLSFSKKVYKDPVALAKEASLALDYYNNGGQGSFGIDYTGMGL